MSLFRVVLWSSAIAILYGGLSASAGPFPRLQAGVAAATADWETEELDPADDPEDLVEMAPWLALRSALSEGAWSRADEAVLQVLRQLAESGEGANFSELVQVAPMLLPEQAMEGALDWATPRLWPVLPEADRSATALALIEFRLNRALLERHLPQARRVLEEWRQLTSACATRTDSSAACTDSQERWARIDAALRPAARGVQAASQPALPLGATPLVIERGRYRCGMAGLAAAMQPVLALSQPDLINVAVAVGDLDGAIALALTDRELGGDVDPRLPDLLLARYGERGLRDAFANAERSIHERTLPAGRVVVITLFGLELKLPSETLTHSTTPNGIATVELHDQPEEHRANLRASALYEALFDAD